MKELLHKLALGLSRRKWYFEEGDLSEETEEFPNPARGWYQIHTFSAQQEPDFDELEWCIDRKDTLALILIDIGYFRDRDLDEESMDRICRILEFFSLKRYDLIVRFLYDHEGKAMEREPFFFAQVLSHLKQIGVILERYADSIFIYQGMLVGNWGEMHTSRFISEEKMEQMAELLRRHQIGGMYLAVRRPVYWRMLHPNAGAGELFSPDNMGLFDDGMFASESHLGTFGTTPREAAAWNSPWAREDELEFEQALCQYVPNGGEAVYGEFQKELTTQRLIEELRKMQITYLNKVYDQTLLDIWKQRRYTIQGVWEGRSVYEYVGAHLGYRFIVKKIIVTPKKDEETVCRVEIEVENTGFGSFYQEAEVCLECVDNEGSAHITVLEGEMRGWRSGEKRLLECVVKICECEMFLSAARKKDGARIRFANPSDAGGRVVLGAMRVI